MRLNLYISDRVFVLGTGYGEVVKIGKDGSYVVKVPSRGEQHYTAAGTLGSGTQRRLFYHDPIIMEPPKDLNLWRAYKKLSLAIYEEMKKLYDMGLDAAISEEGDENGPDE